MQIRVGCELTYDCPQPTPMILALNVHYSRASDLAIPDYVVLNPPVPITAYRDGFGNWCSPPVRLRACPRHQNRAGGLQRRHRGVPRLHPPGHHLLPLHEHPRALLYRLFG